MTDSRLTPYAIHATSFRCRHAIISLLSCFETITGLMLLFVAAYGFSRHAAMLTLPYADYFDT